MEIIEVAYKWNGGFTKRSRTDYIALHHAEAVKCSPAQVHSWHVDNGWTGIGYHFFVCKDGSVYRGRPLNVVGSHVQGMNNCSVGICAEGDYHNKDKTMPQTQYNAIVELCRYLKDNYYPNAQIVGHREIGSSNCPGQYYPLSQIKADVENRKDNPYEVALEKLKANGNITDDTQWNTFTDFLPVSLAVALIDSLTGGTWTSEEADKNIHWAQPCVISLCGKYIITDKTQWLSNLDDWISKARLLALVDSATGGTLPQYKGRVTDVWCRNNLDSLCDKGIISDPTYWANDFEATVEKGVFLLLCCNAFGL